MCTLHDTRGRRTGCTTRTCRLFFTSVGSRCFWNFSRRVRWSARKWSVSFSRVWPTKRGRKCYPPLLRRTARRWSTWKTVPPSCGLTGLLRRRRRSAINDDCLFVGTLFLKSSCRKQNANTVMWHVFRANINVVANEIPPDESVITLCSLWRCTRSNKSAIRKPNWIWAENNFRTS